MGNHENEKCLCQHQDFSAASTKPELKTGVKKCQEAGYQECMTKQNFYSSSILHL